MSDEATVSAAGAGRSAAAGGHPVRVLLVEAAAAAQPVRELLRLAPHVRFAVDWARDLQTGIGRLRGGRFDVCVVDHKLPDGDGLELARVAQSSDCRAPIILVADAGTSDLDLQAMALGVADYLDKRALDATRLERTIRYALARQGQAERLSRLSKYDQLTGLANRALFDERVERALVWARRHRSMMGIMLLELDGLKAVGDRLGHRAADRLLAMMAKRLTSRLRETDTVARLAGDEFAVLVENLAMSEHADLVARKLLDALAPAATIDGQEVKVSVNLGIALHPRDGKTGPELLRHAERVVYQTRAGSIRARLQAATNTIARR